MFILLILFILLFNKNHQISEEFNNYFKYKFNFNISIPIKDINYEDNNWTNSCFLCHYKSYECGKAVNLAFLEGIQSTNTKYNLSMESNKDYSKLYTSNIWNLKLLNPEASIDHFTTFLSSEQLCKIKECNMLSSSINLVCETTQSSDFIKKHKIQLFYEDLESWTSNLLTIKTLWSSRLISYYVFHTEEFLAYTDYFNSHTSICNPYNANKYVNIFPSEEDFNLLNNQVIKKFYAKNYQAYSDNKIKYTESHPTFLKRRLLSHAYYDAEENEEEKSEGQNNEEVGDKKKNINVLESDDKEYDEDEDYEEGDYDASDEEPEEEEEIPYEEDEPVIHQSSPEDYVDDNDEDDGPEENIDLSSADRNTSLSKLVCSLLIFTFFYFFIIHKGITI